VGFSVGGLAYAITAAVTAGYGVYSGERQNKLQKEAANRQQQAQKTAETAAQRQQKQAAEAYAAANRKAPDVADILAGEQELSRLGSASTMLTGPQGVKRKQGGPAQLLGD
jgi:uncharacterized protein HemX